MAGLLGEAFYPPVQTSAVLRREDFRLALLVFAARV
jgi:hypothetical protein